MAAAAYGFCLACLRTAVVVDPAEAGAVVVGVAAVSAVVADLVASPAVAAAVAELAAVGEVIWLGNG